MTDVQLLFAAAFLYPTAIMLLGLGLARWVIRA